LPQSPDESIARFAAWFREDEGRLRRRSSSSIAAEVGEELLLIDDQLGIEVADDGQSSREMIVTSFSEPRLFSTVRKIVESLQDLRGWKFVALKPPRGFSFAISVGEQTLHAEDLEFSVIRDIPMGIRLTAPPGVADLLSEGDEADELAWLTVETGIGEELAGLLEHVEYSQESREGSRPITELAAYLRGIASH
jgi:hypothetical protein